MPLLTEKKFSFISKAESLNTETFAVINFKGFESISKPYEFDILLVSENPEIDITEVLENPAKFTIHRDAGGDVDYNGIIAQFEQLHQFNDYYFYRALLVPKLWWLNLTHHNQICLNETLPDIIDHVIKDGIKDFLEFEFKTQNEYPALEYVCQYGESHFNFISRWLEREGIYYYFEQNENGEKIIFSDTKIAHTDLPQETDIFFSPPTGLELMHRTEIIKSFTSKQRMLPNSVLLKDHDYEKPSLEIIGTAEVDEHGRGEAYIYGEHFTTEEEGNRLAKIRAEELLCRKIVFFGESYVPFIEPGYTFNLKDHFRESYNRKYLVVEVMHEGAQTGYLTSGVTSGLTGIEQKVDYSNTFTAILSDVQFRPERNAKRARISGTMHAVIDAEGSGEFAELDEQGRYKVRLPFDINDGHKDGKASCYLRRMQPYAGSDYGMHFPLHKGAEVLLSFIDGDPDRPVITGAVPNPETISPVTSENQTKSILRDHYGNEMVFDTTPGDEHIRLHSPNHDSRVEVGKSVRSFSNEDSIDYFLGNKFEFGGGTKFSIFAGIIAELQAALSGKMALGLDFEFFYGGKHTISAGYNCEYDKMTKITKNETDIFASADKDYIINSNDGLCLSGGAGPTNRYSSLINADSTQLVLSFGRRPQNWPAQSQQGRMRLIAWGALAATTVSAGLSILANELASKYKVGKVGEGMTWGLHAALISGIIIAWNKLVKKYVIPDSKIEPVYHSETINWIGMNRDGILLSTSPTVTGGDKKEVKVDADMYAKILLKPNGAIDIHSKTSNGIINISSDQKEISITSGTGAKPTLIKVDDQTGIIIDAKDKATIEISNTGKVTIQGAENIEIDSQKEIILQGSRVYHDTNKVKVKGAISNKSFQAN